MAGKKQATAKEEIQVANVPSVEARIDRLVDREDSNIKAYASVNIDGIFAIHGVKVIESKKGLYVSMPSRSYTDYEGRTQYSDICHPITTESREELINTVTEAYNRALAEHQEKEVAQVESKLQSEELTQAI